MNEALYKEFEELKKQFNLSESDITSNAPDSLGLEHLQYNPKSDEQIKDTAEASLTDSYLKGTEAIKSDYENKAGDLDNKKENTLRAADETKTALEQLYDQRLADASNQALKRGLARSSIIMGQIEEFDRSRIDGISNINMQAAKTLTEIDFELDSLKTRKENALLNFDIQHAANLTLKINELTSQRDKKLQEVIQYNNTLTEKEAKYQADRADIEFSQNIKKEELYDKGLQKMQRELANAKLDAAKKYFESMNRSDAIRAFENDPGLREALGDNYAVVYQYVLSRPR